MWLTTGFLGCLQPEPGYVTVNVLFSVVAPIFVCCRCEFLCRPDSKAYGVNVLKMLAQKSGLLAPPGMVLMLATGMLRADAGELTSLAVLSNQ